MSARCLINSVVLGTICWVLIFIAFDAFAGDQNHTCQGGHNCQDGGDTSAEALAESSAGADSSAAIGDVLTGVSVSQRRLSLLIETDPAVGNAPCMIVRPAWGFGFRGSKTVIDPACMASALQDAQHVRDMEREKAELERARLELERDRLLFERQRFDRELQFARDELELCGECGKQ